MQIQAFYFLFYVPITYAFSSHRKMQITWESYILIQKRAHFLQKIHDSYGFVYLFGFTARQNDTLLRFRKECLSPKKVLLCKKIPI